MIMWKTGSTSQIRIGVVLFYFFVANHVWYHISDISVDLLVWLKMLSLLLNYLKFLNNWEAGLEAGSSYARLKDCYIRMYKHCFLLKKSSITHSLWMKFKCSSFRAICPLCCPWYTGWWILSYPNSTYCVLKPCVGEILPVFCCVSLLFVFLSCYMNHARSMAAVSLSEK